MFDFMMNTFYTAVGVVCIGIAIVAAVVTVNVVRRQLKKERESND